jgi:hypothetical protein
MKPYSSFILILLFITQSAFSAQPTIEYSRLDNDLISAYKLFDFRIYNNSIIHDMNLSKATVLIDRENMRVQLLSWIKDNNDVSSIAKYLSHDHCELIFETVMEGMASSISADGTEVDSVYSNPGYIYNYTATNAISMLNVYWYPIKVDINDFTINISCQGNIQDHI